MKTLRNMTAIVQLGVVHSNKYFFNKRREIYLNDLLVLSEC